MDATILPSSQKCCHPVIAECETPPRQWRQLFMDGYLTQRYSSVRPLDMAAMTINGTIKSPTPVSDASNRCVNIPCKHLGVSC